MKRCRSCGFVNDEDSAFCCKCGAKLDNAAVCRACGAELKPDMNFCGKCGARIETDIDVPTVAAQANKCPSCGAEVTDDAAFCRECGTPLKNGVAPVVRPDFSIAPNTASVYASTPAKPKKSFKVWASEAKCKTIAFEKKHSVIVNGIVAVLALIFSFVALFCPIKITQTDISALTDGSSYDVSSDTTEVGQSIWQVFGALSYLGLDSNNEDDMVEVRNAIQDYYTEYVAAYAEFQTWARSHPYVAQDVAEEKLNDLFAEHYSNINYLGTILAITTIGALDKILVEAGESPIESSIGYMLDTARVNAIISLVFALITAAVQLFIVIVSLVFLILAIVGMVRRKPVKLFRYMTMTLIGAGVGLVMTMVGPLLAPSGTVFGTALTFALLYIIFGAVKAILDGKGVLYIVKRGVFSTCALVAVFLLCSNLLSSSMLITAAGEREAGNSIMSLGGATGIITTCASMLAIPVLGMEIRYSELSAVTAIVVLAVGVITFVALFTAMMLSLRKLAFNTESTKRVDVSMLISIIALLLFAILPAIFGGIDGLPFVSGEDSVYASAQITIAVRAYVYVAMVFAVIAFVWEIAFKPSYFRSNKTVKNTVGE